MDRRADYQHTLIVAPALLALALAAGPARASQPAESSAEYAVLSWTENDGLPSNSIWTMAQDADGYLWLGTNEGVFRFDGVRFAHWNAISRAPLPERRVMSLLSASDGSLWVGYGGSGGVSRIRDLQVTNYTRDDGLVEDFVISFTEDREHVIWATSPSGLYRLRGERWERVGAEYGVPQGRIAAMHEDTAGNFWISTSVGMFRRKPGDTAFHQVDSVDSFVSDFSEDAAGAIWTTDPLLGFREVAPAGAANRPSHQLRGSGTRVLHDRHGNLWVGTLGQGLWRARSDSAAQKTIVVSITSTGLAGNGVRSILEDPDGNIWVGADGGLSRLSLSSVTGIRDLGMVRAVVAARDGTVWAGTAAGLIGNPGTARTRHVLRGSNVTALHEDAHKRLWVASDRGVFRSARERFERVRLPPIIQPARIMAMTSDAAGSLWLTDTGAGVFRWKDGRLKRFDAPPAHGRRTAYDLYADAQNRVWVAFSGGLLAVIEPDEHMRVYGPKAGGSLRAIREGRGGTIWVAGDDGLSRLRDGRFVTATRRNGLPGNAVSAVVVDPDGYVWAGVDSGIVRVNPIEFDALADNPNYRIQYTMHDRTDGLAGLPRRLGAPTAFGGEDGRVWFVTGEGLTIVDSRAVTGSRLTPRAVIESVLADDQRVSTRQHAALPPLTKRLHIEFTAPNVVSLSKVYFRYRLDGFDEDWIEAGTERQVSYTALQPGDYRFRVVARTSEGSWSEARATWDFSIKPAFYQTNAFYQACGLALIGLLWAAWRLRLRHIERQFALVLAERTRMGRELHDTLLQSLVGVALQIEALSKRVVDQPPSALAEHLRRMRMQVEAYVREARDSIWVLRSPSVERRDLVTALRQVGEHATTGAAVRFEFSVSGTPQQCQPEPEEQILRIAREAIQNGVLHARASVIRLDLQYEEHAVRLRVADDGSGFDSARAGKSDGHYGLKTMQERAELAGGRLTVVSEHGRGTAVETVIPLPETGRPGGR